MAVFSFEIEKKDMIHIADKSHYNHNYYKLNLSQYGDYFGCCKCDILYEECCEFSETYTYSLGFFEDGKFMSMFSWTEMECKTV